MRAIVGISFFMACLGSLAASGAEPTVKVEYRFGTWEPTAGFTAAKVPGSDRTFYMPNEPDLTNADIAAANVASSEDGKTYVVEITLKDEGARKLSELSLLHLMQPLAILVDGKLVAAPRILSQISRKAGISGNFNREQAERIAAGILGKQTP